MSARSGERHPRRRFVGPGRLPSVEASSKQIDGLGERGDAICPGTRYRGCLPGDAGCNETWHFLSGAEHRCADGVVPRAHPAVETQFADDYGPAQDGDVLAGGEDPESDRQVVIGASLGQVGRRQVHSHSAIGEAQTSRGHRGPDPVLGLAHRGVGEAGELEDVVLTPDVGLDLHRSDLSPDERH